MRLDTQARSLYRITQTVFSKSLYKVNNHIRRKFIHSPTNDLYIIHEGYKVFFVERSMFYIYTHNFANMKRFNIHSSTT